MKRKLVSMATIIAVVFSMTACGSSKSSSDKAEGSSSDSDVITLTCLADTTPHAEILRAAEEKLAAEGIKLDIVSETWDETWNEQVENGTVDFNYDAYVPYLDEWNEANGGHLVAATVSGSEDGGVHMEPLVMMSEKYDDMEKVPDGATVAVKNDATNEYRCLKLLEQIGWITLSDELTLFNASTSMIEKYNKEIEIVELDADVIMQDRQDFDVYLTNTNRLLDAGLDPTAYLARENAEGSQFANVIAINEKNADNETIQKLVEILQSDEIQNWINEKYEGAVIGSVSNQ